MSWLNQHKNQVRSLIVGTIVIGFVILAAVGVYLYRERKATEMMIALRNQNEAMTEMDQASNLGNEEIVLDFSADTVQWQGKTYKKNTYIKAILCLGVDRSDVMTEKMELGEAGQADGIFLVAHDTARNQMKILQIPRDTITEITTIHPDGSVKGTELNHLTLAYAFGDGREGSCENMAAAVTNLLHGFTIDHYLATDVAMIGELNDAVGGVTVTVPTAGMEQTDPAFVKGTQVTLQGKQAEKFVRYRDITVDHSAIFRMNQQKEYITKYFQALQTKSKEDSQIVTKLFELLEDYMVTDMTKDQYLKMGLDVVASDGLSGEDFYTIPGSGVTGAEFDEFYVDQDGMISVVLDLFYREEN
ncbi:MAG: LCP family protein [Lachnospiraceae bacterium]|nr:LCP family protein [Lachnospiraceae bacterium]